MIGKNKKQVIVVPQLLYKKYILNRARIICFLILISVHILDDITTALGLSVGAIETNPVTSHFFVLGNVGYIFSSIYVTSLFILGFVFLEINFFIFERIMFEEIKVKTKVAFYFLFTVIVATGILNAVVSNIRIFLMLR